MVNLTGTLKNYKAVLVKSDEEVPHDYTAIAGISHEGIEIIIAVPSYLTEKITIINLLMRQAEKCLIEAYPNNDELAELN